MAHARQVRHPTAIHGEWPWLTKALQGLIGRTGTGPQIIGPVFTHDTASARASLPALASVDAGLGLPGHGEPFHGPVADAAAQAQHVPR